jgi:hypothetical protein
MGEGVKLQDLQNLPTHWRVVLQAVMRRPLSYEALLTVVSQPTAEHVLNRQELDAAIDALRQREWLLIEENPNGSIYRANIARKPGKRLANSLWKALDDSAEAEQDTTVRRGGNRRLPKDLWGSLEKKSSESDDAQPRRKLSTSLWDKLADDEADDNSPAPPRKQPRKNLWDKLTGDNKESD